MRSCQIYYSPFPSFMVSGQHWNTMLRVWLQAFSSAPASHPHVLQCASLPISTQQPDCLPTSTGRERDSLLKRQDATCFLTFKIRKTNIDDRGEFWGTWASQGVLFVWDFFFLSVVCDKACQSISSTQQAEGQPSPLTCFIYLGVSSRDSKKFNEFDACLLAISRKSRKTWNYLFPQVMSTWRNISKEGKYWYTYQNKHNLEPSAHFRACTAAIRSTEKGYTSFSRKCFPVWGIWSGMLPGCLFILALPGCLQSTEQQKSVLSKCSKLMWWPRTWWVPRQMLRFAKALT